MGESRNRRVRLGFRKGLSEAQCKKRSAMGQVTGKVRVSEKVRTGTGKTEAGT